MLAFYHHHNHHHYYHHHTNPNLFLSLYILNTIIYHCSALGVVKWVLLLSVYAADRFDHTSDHVLFSLQARNKDGLNSSSAANGDGSNSKTDLETQDSSGSGSWATYMAIFDVVSVARGVTTNEPFFHSAISIVKSILRVGIRKKDLELISSLILYTFIPGRALFGPEELYKINEQLATEMANMEGGIEGKEYLSSYSLLRVYLLRLLFSVYDDTIEGKDVFFHFLCE